MAVFTFDEDDEDEFAHSLVTEIVFHYTRILRACIDAYCHGNISVFLLALQVEFMEQRVGKNVDNVNKHEAQNRRAELCLIGVSSQECSQ